jgi:dihydropteroate synthase
LRAESGAVLEPLGVLHGADARRAVAAGLARWLAGGPNAFLLVRDPREAAAPVSVTSAPSDWAGALDRLSVPLQPWASLPAGPLVMGILNVTPDSFSDGGRHFGHERAIAAGRAMAASGAQIVDVGGESTRPGAADVFPDDEQARVLPVAAALAAEGIAVSIDTRNAATMDAALDAGARIVNDVSGLAHDPAASAIVARRRCPVILMHMRGTPETMDEHATYGDVAIEVADELAARLRQAEAAGIASGQVALDPGIGFAKTARQSAALLDRLPLLAGLGRPLLVGLSRKRFVGALAGEVAPAGRDPGSITGALHALGRGAAIIRVHDVAGTVQALKVWQGLGA